MFLEYNYPLNSQRQDIPDPVPRFRNIFRGSLASKKYTWLYES